MDAGAELAIRDALARYCRAMDRMDDELVRGVFHPGATVRYEPGLFTGTAEAFVPWVHELHARLVVTVHWLGDVLVEVAADRATSYAAGHVLLGSRDGEGHATLRHAFGRYADRWSRRDGVWAIDHREYRRELGIADAGAVTLTARPAG